MAQRRILMTTALATPLLTGLAQAQPAAPTAATPAPGFFRFKLGEFTVTTIYDGFRIMPVQGLVRNAPLEEVQAVLAESFFSPTDYRNIYAVTIVDTGRNLVVFDTGNGPQAPGATLGRLLATMPVAGLDPARVTQVVISHFHGDHINGLILADGSAAFPNAEVVVPTNEWAWFTEPGNLTRSPEGQRGNFANTTRRFAPYQGKIRQLTDGQEAVPGIRMHAAEGHSPGHTIWHIASGAEELIYLADTTHRPELIARRPDYITGFDFDGAAGAATRRRVLDRVATDRTRVTGFHFPFPALGYIARDGQGFRYVPADWASAG
jgi:glyoxylase-like metal-dependent hydrolase (beta-lactamase superfamily II)